MPDSGLERQVANDVQRAAAEFPATQAVVGRSEQQILPVARRLRDRQYGLYTSGQEGLDAYLTARREYNEVVRQFLEARVRHRRAMLRLNTAVGERVAQ